MAGEKNTSRCGAYTKLKKKLKFLKMKRPRDIHPSNIRTNFENNPNIGCRVRGVDRRRAPAIGPVDLKIWGYSGGGGGGLGGQ